MEEVVRYLECVQAMRRLLSAIMRRTNPMMRIVVAVSEPEDQCGADLADGRDKGKTCLIEGSDGSTVGSKFSTATTPVGVGDTMLMVMATVSVTTGGGGSEIGGGGRRLRSRFSSAFLPSIVKLGMAKLASR